MRRTLVTTAAVKLTATRAITIRATVIDVWPWIAQLGQGRGGFYSYDRLENLAGCEVRSADRIVPAWQHVAVGDDLRLHPEITLRVALVEPPHALVVAGITPSPAAGAADTPMPSGVAEPAAAGPPYDFTWAFVVAEAGPGSTRLIVRERYRYRTGWAPAMVEPVSVISFVMTQRMLRGIRDRAERAAAARARSFRAPARPTVENPGDPWVGEPGGCSSDSGKGVG